MPVRELAMRTPSTVVRDLAIHEVVTVSSNASMRQCGVRRLPVTRADGTLPGVLSLDDLIGVLAEQADGMVRVIAAERSKEDATRR
jgi:CBS domain-containing protein